MGNSEDISKALRLSCVVFDVCVYACVHVRVCMCECACAFVHVCVCVCVCV